MLQITKTAHEYSRYYKELLDKATPNTLLRDKINNSLSFKGNLIFCSDFETVDTTIHVMTDKIKSPLWLTTLACDILAGRYVCDNLSEECLRINLDDDIMKKRRDYALKARGNDEYRWSSVNLIREIAGYSGIYPHFDLGKELKENYLFDAFENIVVHLKYFNFIREKMAEKGLTFNISNVKGSTTHDIDKFDLIMLVGYSDRFDEKNPIESDCWAKCLKNHYALNKHHETNEFWKNPDTDDPLYRDALLEMLCDKISRRLEKNFKGNFTREVFDIELSRFNLDQKYINDLIKFKDILLSTM